MNRLFGLLAARKHAKRQAKTSQQTTFPLFSFAMETTFDDVQKSIKKSRVGDGVFVFHSPILGQEERAQIQNARTKRHLGVVESHLAAVLFAEYGEGWTAEGSITRLLGGEKAKPIRSCEYQIDIVTKK